jgi:hypothetical protein
MLGRIKNVYVNQQKIQLEIYTFLEFWMHKKPFHDLIFPGGLKFFMINSNFNFILQLPYHSKIKIFFYKWAPIFW